MNTKKYTKGGALKPVPSEKKGLSKLPTEVRNKMGYMMGGGKMEYAMGGKMGKKIERLENREASLVARGSKAVDEGRERKADRLLGRAARVENRLIKAKESAPAMGKPQGGEAANKFASKQAAITAKMLRNQQLDYQPGVGKPFGRETYTGLSGRGGFKSDPANKLIPFAKSGGGKIDMMYQNGGKQDPPRKPGAVLDRNGRPISPMRREVEAMFAKFKGEAYPGQAAKTEKTFMSNARAQEAINLNEMRNALKSEGPASVAKFDKELKAKGYKVVQKPVKKMMGGGKLDMMYAKGGKMDVHDPKGLAHVGSKGAKAPLSTPYNKTKDNNSYISNDVDMSPAIKKQMMALRQAMMYFTGVSPKNK